jgi:hypothetical protein
MPNLAALPGGAAVQPEYVTYLRVAAEGNGGAEDQPHSVMLRMQGFQQPIPLALLPSRAEAEAALDDCLKRLQEAGGEGLVRLPRSLVVRDDEPVYVEVLPEKAPSGRVFVLRLKLETDERPMELGVFPAAPAAIELSRAVVEALGEDFVSLDRGIGIRRRKVQRLEVRADNKADGSMAWTTLIKVQSEPRRLTVTRVGSEEEACAAAGRVVERVNEGGDDDESLVLLPGGFAVRPDGLKGLRVRARREPGPGGTPTVAYSVVMLTDDDEEQALASLADPSEAEALVASAVATFNEGAGSEWD